MMLRGPNPIWQEFNTVGAEFDDTYYAFFLTNTLPYLPQAVFQDPNGLIPWSDPLEFTLSGLPNNLYFDPTKVYRIEFRQGPNQTFPLIGNPVENYIAGSGESIETDALTTAANVITNPQFSDIYFSSPFTYTQASPSTYTLQVAPGWTLVLTGAGTTVLTQGTLPGSGDLPGNPPYYLQINNSGWTTAQLIQTFSNNGALFGGGAIAVSFSAEATTNPDNVSVVYNPSGPTNAQNIFNGQVTTGAFNVYAGAIDLNASLNTDLGSAASTQIIFNMQGTGIVAFSNIQITGQSTPLSSTFVSPTDVPAFQQQTYQQIVNNEFNVYKQSLLNEPKNTILTGWNFGLNPWQFETITVTNIAANQYTADQTIVVQQQYVTSAVGNNVAVGQGSANSPENYGYKVKAVTANNQFALVQYIHTSTIEPYWGKNLSSMVTAFILTTHSSAIQFKMRLIYKTTAPGGTGQNVPIASWVAGSDPVFSGGFTAIVPENDPVYTLTTSPQQFSFNKFLLPASTTTTMFLGVVFYTITNMNQAATADAIVINDISLVENDFALPSNPITADECLRQCQYYFEKSYRPQDLPNSVTNVDAIYSKMNAVYGSNATNLYLSSFGFAFKTIKCKAPGVLFYSPLSGTVNFLTAGILQDGSYITPTSSTNPVDIAIGDWADNSPNSLQYKIFLPGTTSTSQMTLSGGTGVGKVGDDGSITFHYTVDSRIG